LVCLEMRKCPVLGEIEKSFCAIYYLVEEECAYFGPLPPHFAFNSAFLAARLAFSSA
jgi:hypothetical protein